jgi:hypothetical protein
LSLDLPVLPDELDEDPDDPDEPDELSFESFDDAFELELPELPLRWAAPPLVAFPLPLLPELPELVEPLDVALPEPDEDCAGCDCVPRPGTVRDGA